MRRTQLRQSNMLDSRTHSDTMDISLSACVRLEGMDEWMLQGSRDEKWTLSCFSFPPAPFLSLFPLPLPFLTALLLSPSPNISFSYMRKHIWTLSQNLVSCLAACCLHRHACYLKWKLTDMKCCAHRRKPQVSRNSASHKAHRRLDLQLTSVEFGFSMLLS